MRTIELGLLWAIVLAGCSSGSATEAGGHTNWLKCGDLADCAKNPAAVACTDGYCVDGNGKRLTEGAGGRDGGAHREGGGQSATGGASGTSGGRDGGRSGAAGTGGGATGGAATGGAATGGVGGGSDGGGIRVPACPGPMTEHCASTDCVEGGTCLECPPGQVCLEVYVSCASVGGGTSAQCVEDPCAGRTLDCSCAKGVCDSVPSFGIQCFTYGKDSVLVGPNRAPFMMCSGGGICASPDTPIDTPDGEVPIARLHAGDLVYSIHDHGIVAVPLAAVSATPVNHHHVLRIELEGGKVLEVSAPHPVLDGRHLSALAVGEQLDGHRIVAIDRIPYRHAFTHDILPASDTGAYRAGGVWLGSTLKATAACTEP
jgi:hypothetical protein